MVFDSAELQEVIANQGSTFALYYENPYTNQFKAKVLKILELNGKVGIVLDQTAFYPEGGGQPGDRGFLQSDDSKIVPVIDTIHERGVIIHLAEPNQNSLLTERSSVEGRIDWQRRYSLMKSHSASHIVFSAIRNVMNANDLGYKGSQLGVEKSRVDVNTTGISHDALVLIERKANQICQEKRQIRSWYEEKEEALRKFGSSLGLTDVTPTGRIRIVEIDDWDRGACCGTHVASSIEASPIKILGRERISEGTDRIEFLSGEAAYDYFHNIDERYLQVSRTLNAPPTEVVSRLQSLLKENQTLKAKLGSMNQEKAIRLASELSSYAETHNGVKLIVRELMEVNSELLREIGSFSSANHDAVIVLGTFVEGKGIVIASSANSIPVDLNLGSILSSVLKSVGGKGGGSAVNAQGLAPSREALKTVLESCKKEIVKNLGS